MGEGRWSAYAALRPVGKLALPSPVRAKVCRSCGEIVSVRVEKPERFR